jgi:hypothetical protein
MREQTSATNQAYCLLTDHLGYKSVTDDASGNKVAELRPVVL